MKIACFISSMRQGGAERVMQLLVNELSQRGHCILLVTNTRITSAYKINKDIKLIELYDQLHSNNKIIRFLHQLKRIRSIVSTERPDVIVSFMYGLNARVLLASLGLNIPIIVSEHTRFQNFKECSITTYFIRFYINKLATKVTVLTKRDFNFIGNRLHNIIVMPNPLSFPTPLNYPHKNETRILACGSIDRFYMKGFDLLVKIWQEISSSHPNWCIDIAGGGNEANMQKMQQFINQAGLSDSINLLGSCSDMLTLYRSHPIFMLTSRFEGFSMVLAEAMSQGCACISFDCPAGPAELIRNEEDGILVPPENVQTFASELTRLIDDETLRERLGRQAIQNISRFSLRHIIDRWEHLLAETVNQK